MTQFYHRSSAVQLSCQPGQRVVFLDRDGTVCWENPLDRANENVALIPGSATAVRILKESGYFLVVVSNQPRVARGQASEERLIEVNRNINRQIWYGEGTRIDAFIYCPHDDDSCPWRKPNHGMLEFARDKLGIDLSQTTIVGDSHKDILAGQAVRARTILVATTNTTSAKPLAQECNPDYRAADFLEAAKLILKLDST